MTPRFALPGRGRGIGGATSSIATSGSGFLGSSATASWTLPPTAAGGTIMPAGRLIDPVFSCDGAGNCSASTAEVDEQPDGSIKARQRRARLGGRIATCTHYQTDHAQPRVRTYRFGP